MKGLEVYFKGRKLLLIGPSLKVGGPLATQTQYRNGDISFAQLNPDGTVFRFREQIGTRKEIKIIRRVQLPKPKSLAGVMLVMNVFDRLSRGL